MGWQDERGLDRVAALDTSRADHDGRQGLVVLAGAGGDHFADLRQVLLDLLTGRHVLLEVDGVPEADPHLAPRQRGPSAAYFRIERLAQGFSVVGTPICRTSSQLAKM